MLHVDFISCYYLRKEFRKVKDFIEFMQPNGIPVQRTSAECMDFLQNTLGYTFEVSRGVLGLAVSKGYILVTSVSPIKTYN